jgi:DNA-binding transcriptional LysR family regulator
MDTRFLESFLVVVQSGSVAEAARRLDLTPAALAQRIRTLESELRVKLLTRAGRTARPTEAGRAIVERGQLLLQEVRELRGVASARVLAGRLRVGAVSTALTGLLPEILARLSETCPQLDVYLIPGTSADLYQRLLNGDLDAAVFVQPPFELPKVCASLLLRKEPLVVISPPEIPSAEPKILLSRHAFIRYDRHHWGGRLADSYLKQAGIRPRERLELDALDAIAVLVARGLGVSLIPNWAPPWPAGLVLRKTEVDAPAYARRIGLFWMRDCINLRLVHILARHARTAWLPKRST